MVITCSTDGCGRRHGQNGESISNSGVHIGKCKTCIKKIIKANQIPIATSTAPPTPAPPTAEPPSLGPLALPTVVPPTPALIVTRNLARHASSLAGADAAATPSVTPALTPSATPSVTLAVHGEETDSHGVLSCEDWIIDGPNAKAIQCLADGIESDEDTIILNDTLLKHFFPTHPLLF